MIKCGKAFALVECRPFTPLCPEELFVVPLEVARVRKSFRLRHYMAWCRQPLISGLRALGSGLLTVQLFMNANQAAS